MFKRLLIALGLVGLICGGLVWFNLFRDAKIAEFFAAMPPKAVTVSATEARFMEWRPGIEAIGTARAAQGVDLAAETAGVVRSVNFSPNQRVERGQVLVRLDDEVERAQIPGAEAALANAQKQFARLEELRAKGVATEASFEDAKNALAAALSELQRLRAVVDQKSIEAPFSGEIGIARVDVGEFVTPGTKIATLQNRDVMRVDFTVPEQLAAKLTIAQRAEFGPQEDDLRYAGRIIGVDPKVDPQTRLVSVRAQLTNLDGNLRPGQFVYVRVHLSPEPHVLALPQTAVVTSLYGDYVYVLEPYEAEGSQQAGGAVTPTHRAVQTFVQVGRRDRERIEIRSGLKGGELVVTAGQNKLQNGSLVAVNNSIDPARIAQQGR